LFLGLILKNILRKHHKKGFYDWLIENTDYIKDDKILKSIYNIFDLSTGHFSIKIFENIKIRNGPIFKKNI
jgi:hypothetical protein